MRYWFFLLVMVMGGFLANAQNLSSNFNLVPNSSFEFNDENLLINDTSFVNNPICWVKANKSDIPLLGLGGFIFNSVKAHTGATAGLINFGYAKYNTVSHVWTDTTPTSRTYFETKLLKPLVAGQTYYFSLYAGTIKSTLANYDDIISNIGAYFSTTQLRDFSNFGRINVTPQIRFVNWTVPLNDSFIYTKLTAAYTAQGGEQFLTIGNFDYVNQFNLLYITPSSQAAGITSPFYRLLYVDDVALVSDTTQPIVTLPVFDLGPDTTLCSAGSIILGGQANFFHYYWNTGDTTRFITITQPGTYWCNADFGCNSVTDTVHVSGNGNPFATHPLSDTTICGSGTIKVQAPTGFDSYLWNTGDTSSFLNIASSGIYSVRLKTSCGQYYSDTFEVQAHPYIIPGININTIPPTVLCQGSPITLITNNTGAGGSPSFQWYKNGIAIQGATNITYTDSTLSNGDTLTIALYSSVSCPTTQPTISNKVGFTVSPVVIPDVSLTASPGLNVSFGQPVTFTASPLNGGTSPVYLWFLNGNTIAGNTSNTFILNNPTENDAVKVRMESKAACAIPPLVFSPTLIVNVSPTGIINTNTKNSPFSVYPNPVKAFLYIDQQNLIRNGEISITDGYGKLVLASEKIANAHFSIDLASYPAGIYFYNMILNDVAYHGKFLKL